ncbi:hypothetical protein IFM89_038826 [Coptis chinensis]|uniref:Uncharacterized protein n=1 Tax=Coptis chinensis TaxID=261450 RepID=A0A835HQH0_9MAGN|nr:hypothetical protein IFM89_038826 [Coptis chinensis]
MNLKRNIGATSTSIHVISPSPTASSKEFIKVSILRSFWIKWICLVSSPTIGSIRTGRTVKGKKQPPVCKVGDVIKEGQIIGYLDQFGTELLVKSDVLWRSPKVRCSLMGKQLAMETLFLLSCHHFMELRTRDGAEGRIRQKKLENQLKLEAKLRELECVNWWCAVYGGLHCVNWWCSVRGEYQLDQSFFDASFDKTINNGATGAILKDSEGGILAEAYKEVRAQRPKDVEYLAAEVGAMLATREGRTFVHLVEDNQGVITTLRKPEEAN